MEAKFIPGDKVPAWLAELAKERRTAVPRREGEAVVFRPFARTSRFPGPPSHHAAQGLGLSPVRAADGLSLREGPGQPGHKPGAGQGDHRRDAEAGVGGRPCDARGFATFDRVYDAEDVKDLNYLARREHTAFITMACPRPSSTCFCHWWAPAGGHRVFRRAHDPGEAATCWSR